MSLEIIHEDAKGRKTKWKTKGTKNEMEVIIAFFGTGQEVKPRNPWGPKGMPAEMRRERLIQQLTAVENQLKVSA